MVLEPVILKDASKHLTPPLTCTKLIEADLLGLGVRVSASFRKKILCLVFCVFLMQFGFRRPAPFVSSPIHLLCLCSRSCAWKWQNQLVNVKQKYVQLIQLLTRRYVWMKGKWKRVSWHWLLSHSQADLYLYLYPLGWHTLPSHANAEACLTGWPNA